jgi:hypothetical protein
MTQNCTDDGGTTSYYQFPNNVEQLQDLIEYRNMNFAVGNIFKAAWRLGQGNSDEARDLRKIVWFAKRELARISKESEQ